MAIALFLSPSLSAPIAKSFTVTNQSQNTSKPTPIYTSGTLPIPIKKNAPLLPVKPTPNSKPKKCIALFNYTSSVSGDLNFEKDQIIWVTKEMGEWSEGTLNGKKGIFPTSYVSIIQ